MTTSATPVARPGWARAGIAIGLAGALAATTLTVSDASSHREAPLIMEDPVSDNTDLYAFRDPNDPSKVTMISNFVPFQESGGGPNYFRFGEDVLYAVHVDNDGDAVEDIRYEFRFQNRIVNPDEYLYATGPITKVGEDTHNFQQTMRVFEVADGSRTELTSEPVVLPPENVGPRTIGTDYAALAQQSIATIDGNKKVFAGQRDDGFYVDIASIFDLGGLRPFNEAHAFPLPKEPGVDTFAGYNVHSIALQVPIAELTRGDEDVIGVWTTASRRKVRVFAGNSSANQQNRGRWVQVSRLGNPLVNEVVVPLEFKDVFNTLQPVQDLDVFPTLAAPNSVGGGSTDGDIPLVTDPILADQIEFLYGLDVPEDGTRSDLVSVFLTGVEGLNQPAGVRPAEMLRLNTAIAPKAPGQDGYSPLGVIAGDTAGFPNGRRVGDDVVDAALRVVAGVLVDGFNRSPNNELTDGVQSNDVPYLATFPYLGTPHQGYQIDNPDRVPTN